MSSSTDIVVVSGLPRSGTSMMMRMIEAAGVPALTDGRRTPDEDNPLGYYELEAVKTTRADASWVAGARGKVVKVIHLLLRDMPPGERYRVVFMRRDLDEVLASQRKMLERSGRKGGALPADALRRQYEAQLREIDAFLDSRPGFSRLDIGYNTLLADPRPQATALARFLELPDAAERMIAAIDPSLYRNRKP